MSLYWGSSFAPLHPNTSEITARQRGERNKAIAVIKMTKKANLSSHHQDFSASTLDTTQHCTSSN